MSDEGEDIDSKQSELEIANALQQAKATKEKKKQKVKRPNKAKKPKKKKPNKPKKKKKPKPKKHKVQSGSTSNEQKNKKELTKKTQLDNESHRILCHKAGIITQNPDTFNLIDTIVFKLTKMIANEAIEISGRKKTVTLSMIKKAIKNKDFRMYLGSDKLNSKKCKQLLHVKPIVKRVKKYQKQKECIVYDRDNFGKIVRDAFREKSTHNKTIGRSALLAFQKFIERTVMDVLYLAISITGKCNKKRVTLAHINHAYELFRYSTGVDHSPAP